MKILELNTEKTWRGGERQTLYNVKGFLKAGLEVGLIARKGFPLSQKSSSLGCELIEVNSNLEALRFLLRYGKNYDVIHAQTAKTQTLAVLSKPFHRRPVVYTRRVDFVPRGMLTKLKYERTDKVVAITEAIRKILVNSLGLTGIEVITEIVEAKNLNVKRARALKDRFGDKKIIATTSALVPHKDPLTMVRAINELSRIRSDFVFLHFGDGPLLGSVKGLIHEFGIEDFYRLMGFVDNVEDFFAIFDVFVMSSEQEGLGSSVLDAFIYKVPVVSTDAGGLKETVGSSGLLCPVKDYRCLAENIDRLLNDAELRERLVSRAYTKAKERHSIEAVTDRYIELFNRILSPK